MTQFHRRKYTQLHHRTLAEPKQSSRCFLREPSQFQGKVNTDNVEIIERRIRNGHVKMNKVPYKFCLYITNYTHKTYNLLIHSRFSKTESSPEENKGKKRKTNPRFESRAEGGRRRRIAGIED